MGGDGAVTGSLSSIRGALDLREDDVEADAGRGARVSLERSLERPVIGNQIRTRRGDGVVSDGAGGQIGGGGEWLDGRDDYRLLDRLARMRRAADGRMKKGRRSLWDG